MAIIALLLGGSTALASEPLRLTFVGDIMLDGGPGHIVTTGGDPFAAVATMLRQSDLVIGNLECAVTRAGHAVDKPYTFKGPLAALPLLKKYFAAVSLANNHSGDWGKAGFADALVRLEDARVPVFGGGRTERAARAPLVLTSRGRRVALLGYNDFPPRSFAATRRSPGTAWLIEKHVIADLRAAHTHADLVVLYLHWGEELEDTPTPAQQALARRLIDAGADAVIGAHPHVTQTIEWYRDRPIVYILGNFVFDYFPTDPPRWTGWIVQLTYGDGLRPALQTVPVELDAAGMPHLMATPQALMAK